MYCTICKELLNEEEMESPRKDKDETVICDKCWGEKYEHLCPICENIFDKDLDAEISPKHIIVSEYAGETLYTDPGIYEVIKYPFYADGMIEMSFYLDAIKWIAPIPADLDQDNIWNIISYICLECATKPVIK